MGSIHERLDTRKRGNSLNFLRLVLAVIVIVSHAAPIGGFETELSFGGLTLGNIAVGGFFAISGYLITKSRFASELAPYLWRRFLRIYPGYWACLVVMALVFAAISGAVRGGWTLGIAASHVFENSTMIFGSNPIGPTLNGAPFPWTWNGSLWTLRYELMCYAVVGLALLLRPVRRARWVFTATFAVLTVGSLVADIADVKGIPGDIALLVPFFLAGAVLFRYADRIPIDSKLAAVAGGVLIVVLWAGYGHSLAALPIAYLCMWAGIVLPEWCRKVGAENDLSYGVYLYGFPVQQMLVLLGAHQLGLPAFAVFGVLATLPLAAASWFVVERPALSFKNMVGRPAGRRLQRLRRSPTAWRLSRPSK
jgi:peptidoglycan/LPS O-acetylase OafA/YrhL